MTARLVHLLYAFGIVLLAAIATGAQASEMPTGTVVITTTKGKFEFSVERADTQAHQARGLMHRQHMPAEHGMLFTWPADRHITMWMANTPLSLDMVFIEHSGRVHRVEANTIPFSRKYIPSGKPVRRVLELNAGTAARIGLQAGDLVKLK